MRFVLAATLAAGFACSHAAAPPAPRTSGSAIERSNDNAQLLLAVQAKFMPETAARLGVPGLDDRIADLTPGHRDRLRQATREALTELRRRLDMERDPVVAQASFSRRSCRSLFGPSY